MGEQLLSTDTRILAQHIQAPMNFLVVGNPGVGKSTILNSIVGKAVFKSGVSYGKGLTFELDTVKEGAHTYMDTPGLADMQMRKQAAAAITQALKLEGNYKIIFVVTLESGRLRPADKTTMELVLASAPIQEYGLIINKLSKKVASDLMDNPKKLEPSPLVSTLAD